MTMMINSNQIKSIDLHFLGRITTGALGHLTLNSKHTK